MLLPTISPPEACFMPMLLYYSRHGLNRSNDVLRLARRGIKQLTL